VLAQPRTKFDKLKNCLLVGNDISSVQLDKNLTNKGKFKGVNQICLKPQHEYKYQQNLTCKHYHIDDVLPKLDI